MATEKSKRTDGYRIKIAPHATERYGRRHSDGFKIDTRVMTRVTPRVQFREPETQ